MSILGSKSAQRKVIKWDKNGDYISRPMARTVQQQEASFTENAKLIRMIDRCNNDCPPLTPLL